MALWGHILNNYCLENRLWKILSDHNGRNVHIHIPHDLLPKLCFPLWFLHFNKTKLVLTSKPWLTLPVPQHTHTFFKPWNILQHTQNSPEDDTCPCRVSSDIISSRSFCYSGASSVWVQSALTIATQHSVCPITMVPLDHKLSEGRSLCEVLSLLCYTRVLLAHLALGLEKSLLWEAVLCTVGCWTASHWMPVKLPSSYPPASPKVQEPKMSPDIVWYFLGEQNHP